MSSPKTAAATGANATPAEGFKGRDDFRREKQLQEARMAGSSGRGFGRLGGPYSSCWGSPSH